MRRKQFASAVTFFLTFEQEIADKSSNSRRLKHMAPNLSETAASLQARIKIETYSLIKNKTTENRLYLRALVRATGISMIQWEEEVIRWQC